MHFLNCSHSHRYHDRKQVVICAQLKKKSLIMKKIYELTTGRALKYFLQHDSYTTLELPSYVDFSSLLEEINSAIDEGKINFQPDSKSLMGKNINYEVLVSKDGLYSWRRITLINPLYYVYFCKLITSPSNWKAIKNKFREFESNDLFMLKYPSEQKEHLKRSCICFKLVGRF